MDALDATDLEELRRLQLDDGQNVDASVESAPLTAAIIPAATNAAPSPTVSSPAAPQPPTLSVAEEGQGDFGSETMQTGHSVAELSKSLSKAAVTLLLQQLAKILLDRSIFLARIDFAIENLGTLIQAQGERRDNLIRLTEGADAEIGKCLTEQRSLVGVPHWDQHA